MDNLEEGMTVDYLVGLVGSGISGSLSPALHTREASVLGLRYEYRIIDIDELGVSGDDVGVVLAEARRAGFRGLNVTHPCKQSVIPHLDRLSSKAARIGAVNTVIFGPDGSVGDNTDLFGFKSGFERGLPDVEVARTVVVGAGGAGSAVASSMLELGTKELTLVDLVADRARRLAERLVADGADARVEVVAPAELGRALGSADGIVNATPVGMVGHPGVPFDPAILRRKHWVADVIYRPLETPLLEAARRRGCRVLDGGGMVVFQAFQAFFLFAGVEPDAERMLAHFKELVAREPGPSRSGG